MDNIKVNSKRWLSLKNFYGEEWRNVIGWEDFYLVSNYGRVKSLSRKVLKSDGRIQEVHCRILRQLQDKKGYYRVMLSVDGERKVKQVHRLVAESFIPNIHNYSQINHKDENPSNNFIKNLEWCSVEYNLNFGTRNHRASISLSSPVRQYSLDGKYIRTFYGTREAGRQIGHRATASANIAACCRGERNNAYGYIWEYV
jgi:hypothetical protein